MKTRTLVLFIAMVFICKGVNGQFFKKIANRATKAAEETVLQKIDEKTTKKTEKTMDTLFDGGSNTGNNNGRKIDAKKEPGDHTKTGSRTAIRAKDFVPGNKVLYSDTFSNDALGDFPVTWNTNAGAEVVTFQGDDTRWLRLSNSGNFTPEAITGIPKNATLEFDLFVDDNYNYYSSGLWVNFVEVNDRNRDFTKWTRFKTGENGVRLWLHPVAAERSVGRTRFSNYAKGASIMENDKTLPEFTITKNLVHVAVWRQENRIRVYIDDSKIWDLPRAFGDADYNSLVFGTDSGKNDARFYVANLRLAMAGEDTRHALLETGKFETNEILFDTGKATIQKSSYRILNELGELLEKNSGFDLNIVGHTDAEGSASTNRSLSEDRAKSVKEYLTDNFAIKGNRLYTEGKGATVPIASNETSLGRQKNRRVEFIKI